MMTRDSRIVVRKVLPNRRNRIHAIFKTGHDENAERKAMEALYELDCLAREWEKTCGMTGTVVIGGLR